MRLPLLIWNIPPVFCDVRFQSTTSHTIVILIVFVTATVVVLGPCMLGVFRIKQAIDKERQAMLIDEASLAAVKQSSVDRTATYYQSEVPDIKELTSFRTWFSLFEKRVASSKI